MADATVEKKEEVKIEEEDDMPALEDVTADDAQLAGNAKRQSKAEKKMRKSLMKLGLKSVPGITKVTVRKGKQTIFVVQQPDVFKSPAAETYVVFGQAKEDDVGGLNFQELAANLGKDVAGEAPAAVGEAPAAAGETPAASGDAAPTEDGLNAKDIELVMNQGKVDRAAAIAALKKANGDMVAAIMDLSLQK